MHLYLQYGAVLLKKTALIEALKISASFYFFVMRCDAPSRQNGVLVYLQNLKNRQVKLLINLQSTKSTQLSQFMFIVLVKFEVNLPNK